MMFLPEGWLLNLCLIAASLLFLGYLKVKSISSYFEKKGVPYIKPVFLLGSVPAITYGKESLGGAFSQVHAALKGEQIGGFFIGLTRHWLVRDPDYINLVLTTNFDHFSGRGILVDEKVNPLEAHLFFLSGSKWRYLRNKLSPIFTAGKLKYMYEQMHNTSETLLNAVDKLADEKDVDLKELFGRFSTDVIGSTAFGLEPESMINPKSKFREMGMKFFDLGLKNMILFAFRFAFPKLVIFLKLRTTESCLNDYFLNLIHQVLKLRRETGRTRNDFIQLAIQIQEKGSVDLDEEDEDQQSSIAKPTKLFEFTDNLLAAQSFVFFLAGFETTSTTLNFLMYTLANHQEVQDKAREQVKLVKKNFGSFTYDSLKNLTYLDLIIAEVLRIYPPVPWIIRDCTKSFTFPNGVEISKGERIAISSFAIQRDKNYYPDPEIFRPERFENQPRIGTYFPFGDGPRICIVNYVAPDGMSDMMITPSSEGCAGGYRGTQVCYLLALQLKEALFIAGGKRFAQVELKMTIASLLDRFTFEKSPLDNKEMEYVAAMTLVPKKPLLLRIKRNKT